MLEDFQVRKLGRVNLIVGKNNSGKSTVLEALQIYAGRANQSLLISIAEEHNETYLLEDNKENSFDSELPFEDLFSGRQLPKIGEGISIGEINDEKCLKIISGLLVEEETIVDGDSRGQEYIKITRQIIENLDEAEGNDQEKVLIVKKGNELSLIHFIKNNQNHPRFLDTQSTQPCSVIPTRFIAIDELANIWDKIALTEHEETVKKALRIIVPELENLTFVVKSSKLNRNQRQAKVKISGLSKPVPLKSLGDGMLRILQIVLKIFSAKDGFLLIDEFENGLHYSVQEKVWDLLFTLSEKMNIQVFATTHSWDCIESFSKVSKANTKIEGVLFRVGKSIRKNEKGKVIATVFDENQLYNVTQSDVEVR